MVVGVTDGDTIKVVGSHNKQVKIRLYGIDTPERGQPFQQKGEAIYLRDGIWEGG